MPRKSAAALEIATVPDINSDIMERPRPPVELTKEQAKEWQKVINRMPADWFPEETHAMLAQYCRHVVAARHVAQLIQAVESGDDIDVSEYDKLLKMQDREGRAISSLATKMRMSQQTTYDRTKKKPVKQKKPWE